MAADKFLTIAITTPVPAPNEGARLTSLLRDGRADRVHLRYPGVDAATVRRVLEAIPVGLYPRLSLHDAVELTTEFPGVGVHLNARNQEAAKALDLTGRTVSRSCHTLGEVMADTTSDYVFLSPIFDSISKEGYRSAFALTDKALREALKQRHVVALGGVTPDKFAELEEAGFVGAAMLGHFRAPRPMLQFVTHAPNAAATIEQARGAIAGGCRWVQVRMKSTPAVRVAMVLEALAPLCRDKGVTLIVDDHVELACMPGVDGVHLGQTDMPVSEAREILGPDKIIGLTVNTMEQAKGVGSTTAADYLGVGPWRFTATKQRLAPVLGAYGIAAIIRQVRAGGYSAPIVVIGGVTADDVRPILSLDPTGNTGVAVSGAIAAAANRVAATQEILKQTCWLN